MVIAFLLLVGLAIAWMRGIDFMLKNYPKYKGEDFYGDKEKDKVRF